MTLHHFLHRVPKLDELACKVQANNSQEAVMSL